MSGVVVECECDHESAGFSSRFYSRLNCDEGSIFRMPVRHQILDAVEARQVAGPGLPHGGDRRFVRDQRLKGQGFLPGNPGGLQPLHRNWPPLLPHR